MLSLSAFILRQVFTTVEPIVVKLLGLIEFRQILVDITLGILMTMSGKCIRLEEA